MQIGVYLIRSPAIELKSSSQCESMLEALTIVVNTEERDFLIALHVIHQVIVVKASQARKMLRER